MRIVEEAEESAGTAGFWGACDGAVIDAMRSGINLRVGLDEPETRIAEKLAARRVCAGMRCEAGEDSNKERSRIQKSPRGARN